MTRPQNCTKSGLYSSPLGTCTASDLYRSVQVGRKGHLTCENNCTNPILYRSVHTASSTCTGCPPPYMAGSLVQGPSAPLLVSSHRGPR
jgi:hypothetical protein